MRLSIIVLLAAFASAASFAAQPVPRKPSPGISDPTFSRGAPLPKWAQALAEIPPTQRSDPVVTRLAEVQARVGASSSLLVNQAIQVNDPASLSDIGQYAISYFPSYQKLQLHRVAIIRAGQVMDRTATANVRLLERESGVEAGVYGGEKSVQLLLEDVRAGDTLWITYTTEGSNPVFGKHWAQDFSWDRGSPVELRRLTMLHPSSQRLYWRQLGDIKADALEPVIDKAGDMERIRFEGRGLEAVQFEPSIPPDFVPVRRLQLSEYPDWQAVAVWADGLFPRAAPSPGLKQLAARFGAEKNQLAQASAALHWVQEEIRYFSVSIGENSHRPQAPDTVLARRYGDCKDKSYLLVSLLAQLGISARPVLVNAAAPKLPGKLIASPSWFDHVVVRIELDGVAYFVDPTRTGQKGLLTRLPPVLPGGTGLLIAADTKTLLTLPEESDLSPLMEFIENIGIASFDGDATLEARLVYRGAYTDWARRRYPVMPAATLKKELLARYEKGYPGVTLVQAPQLVDDADGGRFEVVAHYKLPKPVTLEDGRYWLEYDSQILADTIGVPAKVVRLFPFRPPQGKFRGRYRLNLTWPAVVRMNDAPVMKSLDNPFFSVSEEYSLRGNYVSYLLDYRVKSDHVAADAVPELSVQAKKLNPFASGRWRVNDANLALPAALGYSYRNFESVRDTLAITETAARLGKSKDKEKEFDMAELCELSLRVIQLGEIAESADAAALSGLPAQLGRLANTAGARRCLAQVLFAMGRFGESVALFQAESPLKDDDALVLALAWARFYSGDGKGAAADLARYRAARLKAGALDGLDTAAIIALLQRLAETVPEQLLAYGKDIPDGPWPRPLVAMQAGVISEDALVGIAAGLPADARDFALNEAWFYIGQRRLAAGDKAGAEQAFRWFSANGIRGMREYWMAKHERLQFEPKDPDYLAGMAAEQNFAEAVPKFRAAAGRGLAAAQYQMALVNFHGDGVKQDYAESMRWARMAAEQGVPGAMNLIGNMHDDGLGVPKDPKLGRQWHLRAAERFDPHGSRNLGNTYLWTGSDVADPVKGAFYMTQSAELGNADAQAALASLYMDGTGVTKDDSLALFWSGRASAGGSEFGKRRLADLYRNGRGVPKDVVRSAQLMREAAEAGSSVAMIELGNMYDRGEGVANDPRQAFAWFEKAAQKGHPIGELMLGRRFRDGKGVAVDAAKAVKWLEKSGADGYPMAYSYLAEMFLDGMGSPKDLARGLAYLRKGAESGDRNSQQDLALRLHFGKGLDQDYAAAAEWYRKAADQGGMELSRNNLGDLYENGFGVAQDFGRALNLYRQAASAGHPMGFVSIGSMYERGIGVAPNPQTAYTYFRMAEQLRGGADKDADAAARQTRLAGQLNAAQLAQAEATAAAWKPGSVFPGEPIK